MTSFNMPGFDTGFSFFEIFFVLMFILVFGTIITVLIKGIMQWNKNNNSPILTVDATIVAKRQDVSHSSHMGADNTAMHSSSSTSYYVTFQVESGDRIELEVHGSEYGMLVEGDFGKLTFQGTRYKSFERKIKVQ